MELKIPRLLGEIHDKDTQFTAAIKQNQELVMIGGVIAVLVIAFILYSLQPQTRTGTWRYGVCKVFLERYAEYPTNLKILTVAEKQNSAQIGYLKTNSYGAQESELMECFYNTNGNRISINRITVNRKPLALSTPTSDSANKDTIDTLTFQELQNLIAIGRRELANKKYTDITLETFNRSIPVIMAQEDLDLTMPPPLSPYIPDLKYE